MIGHESLFHRCQFQRKGKGNYYNQNDTMHLYDVWKIIIEILQGTQDQLIIYISIMTCLQENCTDGWKRANMSKIFDSLWSKGCCNFFSLLESTPTVITATIWQSSCKALWEITVLVFPWVCLLLGCPWLIHKSRTTTMFKAVWILWRLNRTLESPLLLWQSMICYLINVGTVFNSLLGLLSVSHLVGQNSFL